MTLTEDDKRAMLRTFLRGGSITAIAQGYACRRETVEDVIRDGVQQIVAQWVSWQDDAEQAAALKD